MYVLSHCILLKIQIELRTLGSLSSDALSFAIYLSLHLRGLYCFMDLDDFLYMYSSENS